MGMERGFTKTLSGSRGSTKAPSNSSGFVTECKYHIYSRSRLTVWTNANWGASEDVSILEDLRSLKHVAVEAAACFCRGGVFLYGRSVIAVQRAFRCPFDIPPRDHVSDWKCVLMWMDAFQAAGNISKERKGHTKTVRTPGNVE
ncbi:hypothetical protein TNCV_4977671 [Trichonephila clavipes]|nr:hypothetical protein TNCV_4977671 [Trichonephila clavipes]